MKIMKKKKLYILYNFFCIFLKNNELTKLFQLRCERKKFRTKINDTSKLKFKKKEIRSDLPVFCCLFCCLFYINRLMFGPV